jgi:voltage-gated potassium channel
MQLRPPVSAAPTLGKIAARFRVPVAVLAFAVTYGVVGFILFEGWSFLDSVYMTVTTLTTVGFGEVRPLSSEGRIFTMSLIAIGFFGLVATVGALADALVDGELGEALKRRRIRRTVERLTDHYIICAFGRVGRSAAEELKEQGVPCVAIDTLVELEPLMEEQGIPSIIGDPTDDDVLKQAGIERARGLVCAVDSDAVNVYITLTARALNPNLSIVARASNPESVDKLYRAGADRVVSPYILSGKRMAFLALRPSVVDYVDMITVAPDLRLDEIVIRQGSNLDGRTVGDACAVHPGVSILALKKQGQDLVASPEQGTPLGEGDLVVALGPVASLSDMEA